MYEHLTEQSHFTEVQKAAARTVMKLYYHVFENRDFDKARECFGPRYIQHSASFPDGIDGLEQMTHILMTEKTPHAKIHYHRLLVDNDYVFIHCRIERTPGDRGLAVADLFRLENGKVVEHWDVWQDVPEQLPHNNTMF